MGHPAKGDPSLNHNLKRTPWDSQNQRFVQPDRANDSHALRVFEHRMALWVNSRVRIEKDPK